MIKFLRSTTIHLPRNNKAKCPIYEHEGRYYVKANKPNVGQLNGFYHKNEEYAEVKEINGYWHQA